MDTHQKSGHSCHFSFSAWLPTYTNKNISIFPCSPSTLSEYLVSLRLARPPPPWKYAHVWLRGQRWRQELGRNAYFLVETGTAGTLCQSNSGTKKFSDAHRHTSEMDNKAEGWVRGRSQEVAHFTCWGARPGMERYMAVNCRKEIAARFSDLCWKMSLAMEF